MYQIKSEGNDQVFQRTMENQHTGLFQAPPVGYVLNTMPNLPSSSMGCVQMPQPPPATAFPLYEEMYNCMQQRWMYSLSGVPAQVKQDSTLTLASVPVSRTKEQPAAEDMDSLHGPNSFVMAQVLEKTLKKTVSSWERGIGYSMAVTGDETEAGSVAAGDFTNSQLRNPISKLLKTDSGFGSYGPQKPLEDSLQKRELRLMKNREAARECRRKKKEYVSCLENRVAVLEQQNKTLIEELRALKDIYGHKVE
ncbi:cyclic AMP-responsive element-binding protein 1-like [Poecilia latipinna]|nr:PREDICTED: cyclic AMP-responsive element-binding protein 1-like [Poecilia latipinna]XP_014915860.1 PREDICTED: cyclic AMP-responsive element-binding protein 1-like [Poecilia latipinna]